MIFLNALLVIGSLLPSPAYPAGTGQLRARTLHGDREVRFLAQNRGGSMSLERMIDGRASKTRKLTEKEWNYLIRELKKLPNPKVIPPECARARMDIVYNHDGKEESRTSCFIVKTNTSTAYARYAQILNIGFE
jgi:hypothetical protein